PGRAARNRKRIAAAAKAGTRSLRGAKTPAAVKAETATTAARGGVGRRNAIPETLSASSSIARVPSAKRRTRGGGAQPAAQKSSTPEPSAPTPPSGGRAGGGASHAPAERMLKRQSSAGDVAAWAARAAERPEKSSRGRSGRRARMGAVKSAMPSTAEK